MILVLYQPWTCDTRVISVSSSITRFPCEELHVESWWYPLSDIAACIRSHKWHQNWLVVWNMTFMTFHSVGNVIIPADELIFFRGIETTNHLLSYIIIFIIIPSFYECHCITYGCHSSVQPPVIHHSGQNDWGSCPAPGLGLYSWKNCKKQL